MSIDVVLFDLDDTRRTAATPHKAARRNRLRGPTLRTDAIGAALAGLTGVWLDRGHVAAEPADLAEARRVGVSVISELDELPGLLQERTEAA